MSDSIWHFDLSQRWDYENGYHLTSDVTRMAKQVAHYELYKSITHLPGHVLEFGVYKGASLIRFATFREILENPFSRKVIGFDAFGEFPAPPDADDAEFVNRFEEAGGDGIPLEELQRALDLKKLQNIELIRGDILETLPAYCEAHPELRIALLHIDVDVYQPSIEILKCLFDKVVSGGLVVFDDYGTVAGETRAADEFLQGRGYTVEKLPVSHIPAFVRK